MTRFAPVDPPPDGLRAAFAAARRRRLRAAGTTTGAAGAGLLLAVVLLAPSATQTLVQEPAPERPAGGSAASPRPDATVAVAPRPRGPALAEDGSIGVPGAEAAPPRRPTPRAPGEPRPRDGYAPAPLERQENVVTVPDCSVSGDRETPVGLCTGTAANPVEQGAVQLYAEVCSTRTASTTLHLPGRNDVDLSVTRDGEELWRWSEWHPDGGPPHVLTLETGTCITWTLRWTVVDRTGRPLPAGDYTLRTTFLAEELAGRDVASARFTVS